MRSVVGMDTADVAGGWGRRGSSPGVVEKWAGTMTLSTLLQAPVVLGLGFLGKIGTYQRSWPGE